MPHVSRFYPNTKMIIEGSELVFCGGNLSLLCVLLSTKMNNEAAFPTNFAMSIYFNIMYQAFSFSKKRVIKLPLLLFSSY